MKRMMMSGVSPFLGILLALCLSLTIPLQCWGAAKTRVAVIDFEQKGEQEFRGKQVGEIVAEWLITSLVRTGRFDVVERAQLQKILKEQQLGMTGMINQETAAKVGELLGVKVIITGSIIQIGNTYEMNARLVSVEDGSILKAEKIRGPVLDVIERMMDSLADTIKKDFPILGYVVMVTGKRAMLDVGKIHGVDPGMRFVAFRQGALVRHPVTGKMLKGEDIKIGEIAVQNVQIDTSWAEIIQEEPGAKIAAGNLTRSTGLEGVAPAPPVSAPVVTPPPGTAMAVPPVKIQRLMPGKFPGGKILVEWAGIHDLLLGDQNGYVTIYRNIGTKESPQYDAGTKLKAGGKVIQVKWPSAPYLVDWNEDGKMDLLVGDGSGYLHLFLNQGSGEFAPGVYVKAGRRELNVGSYASPCVVDWNEDGKKDLVMGNDRRRIYVFLNEGTNEQPIFREPFELNGGSLNAGRVSSPDVVDWNGDGKKDLVIGTWDEEIYVFINKGTNQEPQFENEGDKLPLQAGQSASPRVVSRGYGLNDLVVATRYGEVTYFTNTGSAKVPNFSGKILKAGSR